MKKVLLGLALGVFTLGFIPACSDDATTEDDSKPVLVNISSNQFSPSNVTIKVGQTVRWTWTGGSHNVVSGTSCTADGKFKSGAEQSGGTFEQKFETAGTFPYYCEPHCSMGMTGQIVVQ